MPEEWPDPNKLATMRTWLGDWLGHVSEVTLRLFLLRVFQSHVLHGTNDAGGTMRRIIVVPSSDEYVRFVDRGMLALSIDCACYESLELRLAQTLLMSSTKSEVERRQQLSEQEWAQVVGVMRGEIRAGGWYQCPKGHVYSVGECGGPMQASTCPESGSEIGGQNHRAAVGNTHAGVDGSRGPNSDGGAWDRFHKRAQKMIHCIIIE